MTELARCPVLDCDRRVWVNCLLCHFHWRRVPRELQRAVYRAWDGGIRPRPEFGSLIRGAAEVAQTRPVTDVRR